MYFKTMLIEIFLQIVVRGSEIYEIQSALIIHIFNVIVTLK